MEEKIQNLMKTLGISREDALQVIADDNAINKGADLFPLTEEQKKASKQAKNSSTKKSVPKKREKKVNKVKQDILIQLQSGLQNAQDITVVNDEREFLFTVEGVKYKVVLSQPRT